MAEYGASFIRKRATIDLDPGFTAGVALFILKKGVDTVYT
jgi:hypothetical protein